MHEGCPWLNGVVERFNRTLTEELLKHIIPISVQHLNRLLK
ncbi:integrase core domain-containing protein [Rhodoferax sp.]